MRSRILHLLSVKPDSAAGIADRTGQPRQKINYHMRLLEENGFVHLVETRKRRNMEERILEPTAEAFLISPETLGQLAPQPDSNLDKLSARYLLALAARLILELGKISRKAIRQKKKISVLGMNTHIRFADPAVRKEFSDELLTCLGQLVTKYHDEHSKGGRSFEMMIGIYPTLNPDKTGIQTKTTNKEEE